MDIVASALGGQSDSARPTRRNRGFAMVYALEHPIFRGKGGGSTLKVWTTVCRWARTDRRGATGSRPLGHVVAPEQRLADELGMKRDTVRRGLRRLIEAGLIVRWQLPVRGQVHQRPDGTWGGLATEFLVVPLADEAALELAAARKAEWESTGRRTTTGRQVGRRVRGTDGRFRRSDHAPMTPSTAIPMTPSTAIPMTVQGVTNETLDYETLEDETPEAQTPTLGQKTPRVGSTGNRVAFIALREAERQGRLPALKDDRERAGIGHVLTARLADDRQQIDYAIDGAATAMARGEDTDDAFADALGLNPTEYWDAIEGQSRGWSAARSDMRQTGS